MKKRILSCLMALALCLTLLPATALAEDGHAPHCLCSAEHDNNIKTHEADDKTAFENAKWMASYNGKLGVEASPGSSSDEPLPDDKTDNNCVILKEGCYYLSTTADGCDSSYVQSYKTIKIQGNVTICLNGKQIQNIGNDNGPVFEVPDRSTLTLTNCTGNGQITRNSNISNGTGSGVYVNGGILNLYSGQITKSKGTDSDKNKYGGGVYVDNGGTFNMHGGAITGNHANYGGGVYVKSGTFNMYGGDITRNSASYGGGAGVYVEASGNFIMNNTASVTGNEIGRASNGGGVYVNGGTFTMNNDASVFDNRVTYENSCGGGVYVSGGTFEMHNDASVTGNKATGSGATLNGAGVYVSGQGSKFEMNDSSKVTSNAASGTKDGDNDNGGGVYVSGGSKFIMNGDATNGDATSVSGNTATGYGGGVYVSDTKSTFTMNDSASITSNKAKNGGGVYASGGSEFNMNGEATSVSNNKATQYGGVFVSDRATFTVSDKPTVTGNTKIGADGAASNVYLAGNAFITIGNQGLNGSAKSIGVTKLPNLSSAEIVIAKNVSTDCSGKFFSDDETREVKYDKTDKTNNKLVLKKKETQSPAHEHKWTYKANEATITAICTGEGNCDVNKNGGSVTINAPANLTQGSNGKTATVTVSDNWKGPEKNKITITYWKFVGGNTYRSLDGAPTEVGKYKASITVKDATASKDVTASVVYNIVASTTGKQDQEELKLVSHNNTIAVGEALALSVKGGSTNGAVNYCITSGADNADLNDNVLTAKKVGKVTVTATMAGNDTYNAVTSGPLTLTITENTGGTTPSQPGGSSSGGSGSYDSNPIIKTETKNNPDGSTTKTETRKDGSVTQTTTGKDGSTGTVKTDKNGKTEMNAKLSDKAVEDAKKSGEPVKAPVEVEASRNSGTAPTVKVELPKNAGKTEVEIPVSNAKPGTVAVLVHADGTEEILKASVPTENGIRLTVDGNATVKIIDNSKDFVDTRNHWAREEIDFVSARELVNGMSATRYAPDATATRAQLWTILARQNDANLSGGANWYEKAQLWSKDKGISDGTNPGATITRAQMVTMLWRTMGQPAATDKVSFADVPADSYYAQAVAWAVEGGITQGVGGDRFDPNATCTRAQIAAFLARSMK